MSGNLYLIKKTLSGDGFRCTFFFLSEKYTRSIHKIFILVELKNSGKLVKSKQHGLGGQIELSSQLE